MATEVRMSIPNFNNLFKDSGSQEILDFLLSKIEANDLSPEEALAMISAVHEEMTEGTPADPKVFQSYNNFMKFLEREKPDIFEFVASNWKDKKGTTQSVRSDQNPKLDGTDSIQENSQTVVSKLDFGFKEVKEPEAIEEEEPQESGETEEKKDEVESRNEEGDPHESEGSRGEPEEDIDQKDDHEDKDAESVEDKSDEVVEESETNEPLEEKKEEEEPETVENDSELEPEIVANEQLEETDTGSEKSDNGGDAEVEQEETEWPQMDQPESGEMLNGLEGEGETPPGED
jgi:hypothetical protein